MVMRWWVLRRNEDGWFVGEPGGEHSYVKSLEDARWFTSPEEAKAYACGNETVLTLKAAAHDLASRGRP